MVSDRFTNCCTAINVDIDALSSPRGVSAALEAIRDGLIGWNYGMFQDPGRQAPSGTCPTRATGQECAIHSERSQIFPRIASTTINVDIDALSSPRGVSATLEAVTALHDHAHRHLLVQS